MLRSKWMRLAVAAVLAIAPAVLCHAQKQLVGEWQGTLNVEGQTTHVLWHVKAAPDGSVVSTFDNQDEGVTGIKVKSLEVKGSDVTVTVDDTIDANGEEVHVAGSVTGKLNADASELTGTWEQTAPQAHTGEIDLKRTGEASGAERAAAPQASAPVAAPKIAGDWEGKLNAGGAELTIVLHVTCGPDGKLGATMDSVDQGAMGIPVDSITLDGSKLHFTVDAVQGRYDGTLNADATAINGTWSQGAPMELNFTRAAAKVEPKAAAPTDVDGTWLGTLDLGAAKLRAVFKITNNTDGLTAKMQSPDQSPNWLPVTQVKRDGNAITFDMKVVGASFEGKLSADKQTIDGTFTQMGNSVPLVLKRVKDAAELERRRPQNPEKPYPYREENVTYVSAGNALAGTLTIPPGKGPFPAVLLTASSGPNDRDETLMGHKPFLVLSD